MRVCYRVFSLMVTFFAIHQPSTCNDHHRVIYDLSHDLFQGMPSEETSAPLELSMVKHDHGKGARSEFFDFCMGEKQGTHINAPSTYHHYQNGSLTVDKLPVSSLVHIPAVVIDIPNNRNIATKAPSLFNRRHILTKHDIVRWEEIHGQIPKGAFVVLRTGWSKYWMHPDKFLGKFADDEPPNFPGFGYGAIEWLVNNRFISGVGTECVDAELPSETDNRVKQFLASRNRFSIVQLANLSELPYSNFHVTIAPLKLRGGSGGPARVFATVRHDHRRHHNILHRQNRRKIPAENASKSSLTPKTSSQALAAAAATIASIFLPIIFYS